MEEYQECIGNLAAIVQNLQDDLKHQKISESAAAQRLGVVMVRAKLAQREMLISHRAARALFQ